MSGLTDEYVSLAAAAEISGWTSRRITAAAEDGKIRTMAAFGGRARILYSRADVLRVAGILR
jgi:hypothetical protein